MGWAEVVGKLPARLLTLVVAIACLAFVALVGLTLWSFFTKQPFQIAGLAFGPPVPQPPPPPAIPAGAVVAFHHIDPDHCPTGWEDSKITRGRVILAAGLPDPLDKFQRDQDETLLQNYTPNQHGGNLAQIRVLNIAREKPAPWNKVNTLPWVALTFCEKSQEEAAR